MILGFIRYRKQDIINITEDIAPLAPLLSLVPYPILRLTCYWLQWHTVYSPWFP